MTILLTSSVVAAIVAALLNGFWNRRAAKKVPKTEMRADAYRDFVVYQVSNGTGMPLDTPSSLALVEIKARLLLFGESNVVSAVSTFLTQHPKLNTDVANEALVNVICEMRKSLLTGHGAVVAESIRSLLVTESGRQAAQLEPVEGNLPGAD